MSLPKPLVIILALMMNVLLPLNILLGIAFSSYSSGLHFLIECLIAGEILLLLFFGAYWEYTSVYLRYVYLTLFLLAVLWAVYQSWGLPWWPARGELGVEITEFLTLGVMTVLLGSTIMGLFPKAHAFQLTFPFREGRYLIVEGGDAKWSFLLNYHYHYGRHRRSQSSNRMRYATDIVKLDGRGMTNRGIVPGDVHSYFIYGETVYSPCAGKVVWVGNDKPDNVAYSGSYPHGIGNGVVLQQGNYYIVLGHFRAASVRVQEGEVVREGQILGEVGNAGFTPRPHLHLQVSYSAAENYVGGQGVPIRFKGQFPTKNQVFQLS